MGWKDLAKLASDWADAKKTELLTADRRTREEASYRAEEAERAAQQEAATSFFEQVLPPGLAERVTAARPENIAARRAAADAAAEQERRDRLAASVAAGATATLTLTISGAEQGAVTVSLPCERSEEHPDAEEVEAARAAGDPPPLHWLRVVLESPDPVPVGSASLAVLGLAVPDYHGPGRYDLVELNRRCEAGELGWWEPFDLFLDPVGDGDELTWYGDVARDEPAVIEVSEASLAFDLPLTSAASRIRVVGTVSW